jgi:hypothetical protein
MHSNKELKTLNLLSIISIKRLPQEDITRSQVNRGIKLRTHSHYNVPMLAAEIVDVTNASSRPIPVCLLAGCVPPENCE